MGEHSQIPVALFEQQMLVGGGVAGLAAAIYTASAGVACPVATAAATAAGFWLSNNWSLLEQSTTLDRDDVGWWCAWRQLPLGEEIA